jgi:hypothetical protein
MLTYIEEIFSVDYVRKFGVVWSITAKESGERGQDFPNPTGVKICRIILFGV